MQNDAKSTMVFAAIVCLVASILLAGVATALQGKQKANSENFRKANVLAAFGVKTEDSTGKKISPEEINAFFNKNIVEVYLETEDVENAKKGAPSSIASGKAAQIVAQVDGSLTYDDRKRVEAKKILPVYLWYNENKPSAEGNAIPDAPADKYAIPITGEGLWSTVYGYLGLQGDLATIEAISFYEHGETPGLGAECSEPWFMEQFQKKVLWTESDGIVDFEVRKSTVASQLTEEPHVVGGISAATITANGIQAGLVSDMKRYEPFFKTRRAKAVSAVAPVVPTANLVEVR